MHIILLDPREGREHRLRVSPRWVAGASALLLCVAGAAGFGLRALQDDYVDAEVAASWRAQIDAQSSQLEQVRAESERTLAALTRRFAELQARLVRMEALGQRVADAADVDAEEFDFSSIPAVGGPEDTSGASARVEPPAFMEMVETLSAQIVQRQQQLAVLESVIDDRRFLKDVEVSGRPIAKGWLSSPYGRRVDPIDGDLAWHGGVDFAGTEGSDVMAVASGVVVYSGRRSGYGRLVEINHGNGYVTRYGHNSELRVAPGDIVRKGDVIATMGSTGRSTGPHVHFEVLKDGRLVDPARYIARSGPDP